MDFAVDKCAEVCAGVIVADGTLHDRARSGATQEHVDTIGQHFSFASQHPAHAGDAVAMSGWCERRPGAAEFGAECRSGLGRNAEPKVRKPGILGSLDVRAEIRLPPHLCGPRGIEKSGGVVARRGRAVQSPPQGRISAPAEVLPRWCAGIEATKLPEAIRYIVWIGVYTGVRLDEVRSLRWERIDLDRKILQVDETKAGEVLELPITGQLAAIFGRWRTARKTANGRLTGWVFPSELNRTGHVVDVQAH